MKKKKMTEYERQKIVASANKYLADSSNTQEQKEELYLHVVSQLLAARKYRGYQSIKWIKDGGWVQYLSDGEPEGEKLTEKYCGLEYDRFFY